jgi:hypothetical protein
MNQHANKISDIDGDANFASAIISNVRLLRETCTLTGSGLGSIELFHVEEKKLYWMID